MLNLSKYPENKFSFIIEGASAEFAKNSKHFIVYQKSGHFSMVEEKVKYHELLIDLVL
jgi:hypothetical protein